MSIFQFLRIFVARWLTIVICTVFAAFGALVVAELVRPRFEASARVLLNLAKPDPVTGAIIAGAAANGYLDNQRELIRGERVAGHVVEKFGWLSDPGYMAQYEGRSQSDTRDFKRWLSQKVIDSTEVGVKGTILTIRYEAPSAAAAKVGAEELRQAYLNEALSDRQAYARKYSNWFANRAAQARAAAEQAELAKAAYEKQTGIILTDTNADFESAKLSALAGQLAAPSTAAIAAAVGPSNASMQLIELDAAIAQANAQLGPNHPRMLELKQRRQQIAAMAAQEQRARSAVPGGPTPESLVRELQDQQNKVISQRDKVERLRQLQADVDIRRDEYKRTAARSAELMLEASLADSGSQPLGPVLVPNSPVFPKKGLMVGGATALGLGLGLALALLLELLNRRVRGVEDLELGDEIHCVGVITEPGRAAAPLPLRVARKLLNRSPVGMPA